MLSSLSCTANRERVDATKAETPASSAPGANQPPRWRRSGPVGSGETSGTIARLGAAVSLSGSAALFGAAQRNGYRLAQDEINASHVLGRTRLEVIVEDDGSNRDQAAAVFQKFIENSHVVGILGPTLSDSALAVDPLAQQAGVPVLAVSNAGGPITQIGNFIFRDCLSESQLAPRTINYLAPRLKLQRAALLYADTDPNRAGSHAFEKALADHGVTITTEQSFASDATDLSGQLAEIANTRPDALFVTAPMHSAANILVQARRGGLISVPIVGSNSFNSSSVLKAAGDAAEGLIVGGAWSAANPSARNTQFIQNYRARYSADPDQLAAQAYTGVYIMAAALGTASSQTDPHALRDALDRMSPIDTPLGRFSFNDARDADYQPVIQVVRNGAFQLF